MRDFRVFYAGDPDGVMQLSAVDAEEAACLFFSNEPRKGSIFVEAGGRLGEKVVTYSELCARYQDIPAILAAFEGQKGVIADTLVRDRNLTKVVEDDSTVVDQFMKRFIFTIVGFLVVGVYWLGSLILK